MNMVMILLCKVKLAKETGNQHLLDPHSPSILNLPQNAVLYIIVCDCLLHNALIKWFIIKPKIEYWD